MIKKSAAAAVIAVSVFFSGIICCAENVPEISVSAKACILVEADTGQVLFEKNADEKLPMASTTKIMSALLLLENGNLDEPFTVDSEAIKTEGSSMGLVEGDIVTPYALCTGMLLPSGNDAANAAAVYVAGDRENFARLMNLRAASVGMKNTHFVTPSGLHDDEHYSTARDMSLLAAEALKNPDFAAICGSSVMKLQFGNPPYDRWLRNTNKLLTMCDGCIGVKTGFTDEAGRCLVSACERNGIRLICVTLNDRNDWNDHIKLYESGFSRITPIPADTGEFTVSVAGGTMEKISLVRENELFYPSADGYMPVISFKAVYPPFVYAPVNKGDRIGRLELYAGGKKFAECPLCASEGSAFCVTEKETDRSFRQKAADFFRGIFDFLRSGG